MAKAVGRRNCARLQAANGELKAMNPFVPGLVLLATAGVFYAPMKVLIPALVLGALSAVAIAKYRR